MKSFLNLAGQDADLIVDAELHDAGIQPIYEVYNRDYAKLNIQRPEYTLESWRESTIGQSLLEKSGEVKTSLIGHLHGWTFKRLWCYYSAEGPAIGLADATDLHYECGNVVRVNGHCGCPSPLQAELGFGVSRYHVDTPDGLKALVATLNRIALRSTMVVADPPPTPSLDAVAKTAIVTLCRHLAEQSMETRHENVDIQFATRRLRSHIAFLRVDQHSKEREIYIAFALSDAAGKEEKFKIGYSLQLDPDTKRLQETVTHFGETDKVNSPSSSIAIMQTTSTPETTAGAALLKGLHLLLERFNVPTGEAARQIATYLSLKE